MRINFPTRLKARAYQKAINASRPTAQAKVIDAGAQSNSRWQVVMVSKKTVARVGAV